MRSLIFSQRRELLVPLSGFKPFIFPATEILWHGKEIVHKSAYDKNSILFDIDVVNISEINKEAALSYAAIHCGLTPKMVDTYTDYPSREEMARQLTEINLGYDPEKNKSYDWYKLSRRKSSDINKYWLANKLTHNLGDINKIEFLMPFS